MKFIEVSQVFYHIERESSRTKITQLLADLFRQATAEEARMISYLSLGLLCPPYVNSQFNMAEKNGMKAVAIVLNATEEEVKKEAKNIGDLGSVLLKGSWRREKDLSLTQVYDRLVSFARITGVGSQEEKIKDFAQLLRALDPLSACFIMRIIIGKLRLGFSDMTIIDALSWMLVGGKNLSDEIEHAYNISVDIGKIAEAAKSGGVNAIRKMNITVGVPIRPAAAERLPTAADIIKKLGPCVAQPKLDGFRVQVHVDKLRKESKIWFFSRNLVNMSSMFPDLLEDVKKLDVQDLIIEGEAIAYDEETDSYRPFQETVKRKRKHGIKEAAAELPLHLILFDILYHNGVSLMDKPQQEREEILKQLVRQKKCTSILVVDEKKINTAEELDTYFYDTITAGLEGLVVKRPDAPYQPGKRNFNWIKLKRHEEEGQLEDTLDLVILGYYAGKGKRAHFGIGAFLVGVYNPDKDCFESVAKIGTGLSDDGWRDLKRRCDKEKINDQLGDVIIDKLLTPDVWVAPVIVVMIRADEITRSPVHTAGRDHRGIGYALRFPRFMEYRTDKSATDATTIQELQEIYKHQTL